MSKVCVNERPCSCPHYHPPGGKPQQWVVCAANRDQYGTIVAGARHYDNVMRGVLNTSPRISIHDMEQGFIDQFGNFLTRREAWVIALENNQIRRLLGSPDGILFSEHLY